MSPAGNRPLRVISYAWGKTYVEELLAFTIPALLAPGNLPHVASQVACEVVILTEERFFERVTRDPAIVRLREHCPVRLLGLDDLITAPGMYGMALTYALHRGFSDLGPAMTDCWLIFLNADFVLADGSLRSLLQHLMRGERIVASPSYCVVKKEVVPELIDRRDKNSSTLTISPRELARLALRHRHNTIRGKTLNQTAFHLHYVDQFYWLVDDDTLLGHQMPVAIVGMRPERFVAEPNSFWDHGLMAEFCPRAEVKLLGDSDDFLMIELRDKGVAQEQLVAGKPKPKDLGERMIAWVTPYQRSFALRPLTLHAGALPPQTEEARCKLRHFVEELLSHAPRHLPSHLDHPQWNYHWPAFTASRHRSWSKTLGHKTRTTSPPGSLSAVDQCWWRLDGLQKTLEHRRELLLEIMNRQIETLYAGIDRELLRQDEENRRHFIDEIGSMSFDRRDESVELFPDMALSRKQPSGCATVAPALTSALSRDEKKYVALREEAQQKKEKLEAAVDAVRQHFQQRARAIEADFEQPLAELQSRYDRFIQKRVSSAATPFVRIRFGSNLDASSTARSRKGLAVWAYNRIFGKWPHVSLLSPLWAPVRPLHRIVAQVIAGAPDDVLFVGQCTGIANDLVNLSGMHAWASVEGVTSGNFRKAFDHYPFFDLCICDLQLDEIVRFDEIVAALQPFLREGGTIIGFHLNAQLEPAPLHKLDLSRYGHGVAYAGSAGSARLLAAHAVTFSHGRTPNLLYALRVAARLVVLTPLALLANLSEAAVPDGTQCAPPEPCTSVTITASPSWFEGDDGTVGFAKAAGIYVEGVEAPALPERRVEAGVANPPGTVVILPFGQSNAANEGEGAYEARRAVHVFNVFDMNFYRADDPLLGASGVGASMWGRLGDKLIEGGAYKSVLFVPIAFGASSVKDWAPGGHCYRRLQFALRRLKRAGLGVDLLCWQQEEADANHTDISADQYKRWFSGMVTGIRRAGVPAPIYIAVASLCENDDHPDQKREQIRLAQKQLVSPAEGLLSGPDLDRIPGEHRREGYRFSQTGLDLAAQAWFDTLMTQRGAAAKARLGSPGGGGGV